MDRLRLSLFAYSIKALLVIFLANYFNFVQCANIALCNQTPYPQLCNSLATNPRTHATLDDAGMIFDIRDASLRVTLAHAEDAHMLISTMDLSSFSELGKAAWGDCVELYEDTIYKLNKTLSPSKGITLNDAQTWLSAAITNYQTCQNGFLDFNLDHHLQSFPSMLSDFSKYLSNSLAINKAIASLSNPQGVRGRRLLSDGFPDWVSGADRRLLQSGSGGQKADVTVAQDGSGNYRTISAAVAAASGGSRFVIYVKRGVYKENVVISRSKKNLMLIGDGIDATIITGSKSNGGGSTTFNSATFGVSGDGFIAKGITFENTAGPGNHQAVAMRSGADFSVFYQCSFKGYQDTLYVYSQRQFYRDCDVSGTVDFIFGDAVAVLQNCNINTRKPMSNQRNTVTASGRTDPNENTGIIIHNSRVSGDSGSRNYLGRPWQKYARTVYLKCSLSGIDPAGWLPWSGNFALSTLYYGEYMNTGSGAATGGRVKWPGFHVITSAAEAGKFSVGNFLAGNSWLPATGVPFTSSL